MRSLAIYALWSVALFSLLATAGQSQDATPAPMEAKQGADPYEAFKADQAMLRKHATLKVNGGGGEIKASSDEACQAAHRIFSRAPFLFRTRAEVLDMLGDPGTVSDYSEPTSSDPSSPLVYVFDGGFGGWRYTISFENGRVNQVRADSLD